MIFISSWIAKIKIGIRAKNPAFILPLTLVVMAITLAVSTGISTILVKELFFSKASRESSVAYYSADTGVSCAVFIDDAYLDPATGIGIFPYSQSIAPGTWVNQVVTSTNANRLARGLSTITLSDIKCASANPFETATSSYVVADYSRIKADGSTDLGKTASFLLHFDLGDGTTRCAKVTINKTSSFRQIISQGYTTCNLTSASLVERAVINTTELN